MTRRIPRCPNAGAALVTSDVFTNTAWGQNHPLSIHRHQNVMEMIGHLGWLDPAMISTCEPASIDTLLRLHEGDYVEALRKSASTGTVSKSDRERYNFGVMENPVFRGLFERAAATVGGAILAAELALKGKDVFHPAGGTHHGQPSKASGFCYFNDPAFAILTLLDAGAAPLLYVDLDAHHGDGVEAMFRSDPRVFMISVHEVDRWPYTGKLDDRAGGNARNLPVPRGFHDAELGFLMDEALAPLAARIKPEAVVITCGADALEGDPLSGMALSNCALWEAIEKARGFAPVSVCLGGGGYNPWTVARFWSGLWGRIAGFPPAPEELPEAARGLLASLSSDLIDEEDVRPEWMISLADPAQSGRLLRGEIERIATATLR